MRSPTRRLFLLTLAVAAFALPGSGAPSSTPSSASETVGPYTGVGIGLLDRYRHIDNQESGRVHIVSDSYDLYKGRFTYSFRIDEFGNVEGTGNGDYLTATWNLRGVNGSQGAFSCTIPMTTTPFRVRITGQAADGTARIRFALDGAREANEEQLCGANYYGFATDATRLADSLELVQPSDGLEISLDNPSIPSLGKLEVLGDDKDGRVNLHEWAFTIRAPGGSNPPPPPPPVPVGAGPTNPSGPCTINGTPGNGTLVGSSGRDVICGKAGNDVIRGGGGDDSLRGEGGNDRLVAGAGNDFLEGGAGTDTLLGEVGRDLLLGRDGRRDTLDGGGQRDWAARDRVDRVRNVEVLG